MNEFTFLGASLDWRAIFATAAFACMTFTGCAVASEHPATVQALLDACSSSDSSIRTKQCDSEIYAEWLASIMLASDNPETAEYRLCLPEANGPDASWKEYQEELLHWLRAHPELRNMAVGRAGLIGTKALYECKR
jgi:hypothetical protein